MNKKKSIGFGVFLILLGGIWMLNKLDILEVSIWHSFLKLWPIIFIAIGLSIIFDHHAIAKAGVWIGFFAVLVLYSLFGNVGTVRFENNDYVGNLETFSHTELMNNAKSASIRIDAGGTNLYVNSCDEDLMEAKIRDKQVRFDVDRGKNTDIHIYSKYKTKGISDIDDDYLWELEFTKEIPLDLHFNTGAINGDIDLRDLKVEKLEVDTGASSMKIKLSDKLKKSEVNIRAGVSNLELYVPKNAGLKIDFDGALVVKNFTDEGLVKKGDDYFSENYEDADSIIEMHIAMGAGNIDLKYR